MIPEIMRAASQPRSGSIGRACDATFAMTTSFCLGTWSD